MEENDGAKKQILGLNFYFLFFFLLLRTEVGCTVLIYKKKISVLFCLLICC